MDVSRSLMTVRMGPQLSASPHSAVSSLKCSSGGSLHICKFVRSAPGFVSVSGMFVHFRHCRLQNLKLPAPDYLSFGFGYQVLQLPPNAVITCRVEVREQPTGPQGWNHVHQNMVGGRT